MSAITVSRLGWPVPWTEASWKKPKLSSVPAGMAAGWIVEVKKAGGMPGGGFGAPPLS